MNFAKFAFWPLAFESQHRIFSKDYLETLLSFPTLGPGGKIKDGQ